MPKSTKFRRNREMYGPYRRAWLRLGMRSIVLYDVPAEEDENGEGRTIILRFEPRMDSLNVTHWTVAELDAFKSFINEVLDEARDECARRDKEAQDAYERGEDAHRRLYRFPPELTRRSRVQPQQHPGVSG